MNSGDYTVVVCGVSLYGFARRMDGEAVYVMINNGEQERVFRLPVFEKDAASSYYSLLGSQTYISKPLDDDIEYYNSLRSMELKLH